MFSKLLDKHSGIFFQVNLRDAMDVSTISVDLTPVAPIAPVLPPVLAAPAVRADWDSERERLYQQLDDKVCFLFKFLIISKNN